MGIQIWHSAQCVVITIVITTNAYAITVNEMTSIGLCRSGYYKLYGFRYFPEIATAVACSPNSKFVVFFFQDGSIKVEIANGSYPIYSEILKRNLQGYRPKSPGSYRCEFDQLINMDLVHFLPADAQALLHCAKDNECCQRMVNRLFAVFVCMKEYIVIDLVAVLLDWMLHVQLMTFSKYPSVHTKKKYELCHTGLKLLTAPNPRTIEEMNGF